MVKARGQTTFDLAKQKLHWPILVCLLVIFPLLLRLLNLDLRHFPESWNFGIRKPLDDFQFWIVSNRTNSPAFVYLFNPLRDLLNSTVRSLENFLIQAPWPGIVLLAFFLGLKARGSALAVFAGASLLLMGMLNLWQESMQTLALMGVSVLLALLLGIPIGILSALSNRFKALLRPILDLMQTLPAFVYLIPMVLFFGIARAPSVIATMIYALAPAIRYTDLGIRQVPTSSLEAAKAFGSTRAQILFKVQLPLALPQIVAGINQTIMMAFGIVVIAALIGANGLGRSVLQALQRLQVGRGLEAGLAIALMAIVLDRISHGFTQRKAGQEPQGQVWFRRYAAELLLLSGLIVLSVAHSFIPLSDFPKTWQFSIGPTIDMFVKWSRDNLYQIANLPIGTGPFSDFLVIYAINPLNSLFQNWLVWPLLILTASYLVSLSSSWKLGLFSLFGLLAIGFLGMWQAMTISLSQIMVATFITVILALVLGIASAQSQRFKSLLEPMLDMLQTIPSFVYLIPAIMLFNVGYIPGIIASILYALPPGIKLIDLGLRQVNPETLEAAKAFGSSRWQILKNVQLPLALPSIMLGINQIIMMVLAMVVIAGLVGSGGLGLEAVTGLAKNQTGRGIEAGLAIVLLAMILDRAIQAWAQKQKPA